MTFQLDPRLANDCYQLAETDQSIWLLINNRYFPWFIVVPKTACTELYQLDLQQQTRLQMEVNLISEFVNQYFACDKLNVACIGNIVKQMHLHIIARTATDPCWPGVVWGTDVKEDYNVNEVIEVQQKLKQFIASADITGLHFAQLQ